MIAIHFTHGATDPLKGFSASAARFVPLADGTGDTHISCLHLEQGGRITAPSISHAAALLVVHGRITITAHLDARIQFSRGMGAVFLGHEPYTIESDAGAIVLIVEADRYQATCARNIDPGAHCGADVAERYGDRVNPEGLDRYELLGPP